MPPAPSQKELLDIEQGKHADSDFLEEAAAFLSCKLSVLEKVVCSEDEVAAVRKTLAPREDFVLKLLLKRLSDADDVLGTKFWLLLDHLVDVIPVKRLAHLLSERDFLKSLNQALDKVLAGDLGDEQYHESDVSSDHAGGRPTKRRKLVPVLRNDGTALGTVSYLVCRCLAKLVQFAQSSTEVSDAASNAVRNVLSASPEAAAAVLGKVLHLLRTSLAQKLPAKQQSSLMASMPVLLYIWKFRRPDIVTSSGKSSDQYFTMSCLNPALSLITELSQVNVEHSEAAAAVSALERLVALHSVLPLRLLFSGQKAQQWKAKTETVAWEDIKDLHAVLGTMLLGATSAVVDVVQEPISSTILEYYSIAVRAVPRPTMRRRQQEQAWLESLFSACAHLGESTLPRMVLNDRGHLRTPDSPEVGSMKGLGKFLEQLLTLAARLDVKLTLPVLHYFMTATIQSMPNMTIWPAIARIVEHDINVLVPSTGLVNTATLLDTVLNAISSTNDVTEGDYALVLSGLIRPLLKGFSHARDLKGFISLWTKGLQDAIQHQASGDVEYGKSYLCFAWENDALFQDFEGAGKALTSSNLTRSLVLEMLELLQQACTRVGPTADIMSHVAITARFLNARPDDFDTATIEDILVAAASALSRRSDYQMQRWLLWKLLRRCWIVSGQPIGTERHLQELIKKMVFVSLSTIAGIDASTRSYGLDASLKEIQECFHLATFGAVRLPDIYRNMFEVELEHLIAIFTGTLKPKHNRLTQDNLIYPAELNLASSCAGVLLQYPEVLQSFVSATARLIVSMIRCQSSAAYPMHMQDLHSIALGLLLSEEIASNPELFNECCSGLMDVRDSHGKLASTARDILLVLPLQALKKGRAQKLADVLVERLQPSSQGTNSLAEILADLGLLEMLIAAFSVSVGKPKNWAGFVELAKVVLNQFGSKTSAPYQSVLACISRMFSMLCHRCQGDEMTDLMSIGLKRFQSSLDELKATQEPPSQADKSVHVSSDISDIKTEQLEQIARRMNATASSLGSEKGKTLASLLEQEVLGSGDILLVSAVVCEISAHEVVQDPTILKSLDRLATLDFACKGQTAPDLCLSIDVCMIILKKHPSAVHQYTIDTLVSSITALASPTTVNIPSTEPFAIFDRLCGLVGAILSRHRKRLGGRYHVLLPALQTLLKCLFFAGTSTPIPSQTKSQVLFIRALPSWLRNSKTALPPSSAEHFTRILTTICDPSSSGVRSRTTNELTDQTKRAKSLAGQYMQYLVMSYCTCSLQGRIPSTSKEKLMPGLYSVMDVMDREVMRGMNGAMDSSSRAIFKGLYDDYQRFGRWDRK